MGKSVGPIFLMVDCPARDKGGSAGTFLWAANFVQLFVRQQQNVKDASQPRALCGFITRRTTHWETLRQALPWFTWAKQGQARPGWTPRGWWLCWHPWGRPAGFPGSLWPQRLSEAG